MIVTTIMEVQKTAEAQYQNETTRIETFSDGVFCIAITLLSIEIGIEALHERTNAGLIEALLHKWPVYLAYIISFINILLAWIGHHSLFKNIRNTDSKVMITNGILLMLVGLVPFPTKTLGEFLLSDALKTATVFYTGYFVLISIGFRLLWWAVCRNRSLLIHSITPAQIKKITRNENIGLVCNTVIMLIAFLNPWAALGLSFCMWIYWIEFA